MATKKKTKAAPKAAKAAPKKTKASATAAEGTADVAALMASLRHPLKAEVAALRAIILGANRKIAERVKWNAPSFHYKHDMAAFQLRPRDHVMIVFVFPMGRIADDPAGILEGTWADRRIAKFTDMADVKKKRVALAAIVDAWVKLVDAA